MHAALIFAAASARTNCLYDYVSSLDEACFFGSERSRLELSVAYATFVEGCDFDKCECPSPNVPQTACDAYALKTMVQFMGHHPHTDAPEMSLYRNLTAELKRKCTEVSPESNEAGSLDVTASFGGCNPPSKPSTGHTAGITLYVSLISLVFTYLFLGANDFGGSYTEVPAGPEAVSLASKPTQVKVRKNARRTTNVLNEYD